MLRALTQPAALPIDVALARQHVKQDIDFDDVLLRGYIGAASNAAESQTERTLLATRWQLVLDSFPGPSMQGVPWGKTWTLPGHAIVLPRSPVLAVESIKFLTMGGVLEALDPSFYAVDTSGPLVRITPVFGRIWPVPLPQIGAVQVTFLAGFATAVDVDLQNSTLLPELWRRLVVGEVVRFSVSGGALPAPLKAGRSYAVASVASTGAIGLKDLVSGQNIAFTSAGTGSMYLGQVPDAVVSWMLLRVDSLYAHRGETSTANVSALPFADRLLDPWRAVQL